MALDIGIGVGSRCLARTFLGPRWVWCTGWTAQETLALITRGGPFPYPKDGTVFGNFERRLPIRERGYYREYPVPTPGSQGRGARRIVAGKGGEFYYTEDHYRTFRRIRE